MICHEPLVCHGKCSFNLFLSSATSYILDTQKFPSSESGIPHIRTANQSLFSLFMFRTNMLSQYNVQFSLFRYMYIVVETIHFITDKM